MIKSLNFGHRGVCGVYCIKNILTGDFYIGSSVNIGKRWGVHDRHLRADKHHSIYLQRAYNKYGSQHFIYGIVETCTRELLNAREQYYVDTLNPAYNVCKNVAIPGKVGVPLSDSHKAKISKALKGKKRSEEARKNMSAAFMGRKGNVPSKEALERRAVAFQKSLIAYKDGITYFFQSITSFAEYVDARLPNVLYGLKRNNKFKKWQIMVLN